MRFEFILQCTSPFVIRECENRFFEPSHLPKYFFVDQFCKNDLNGNKTIFDNIQTLSVQQDPLGYRKTHPDMTRDFWHVEQ